MSKYMVLKQIKYQGFRNLVDAEIAFAEDLNYIIGDNGAGKTNLLEAIFYAGNASSFRENDDRSLVRFDAQFFRVEAQAEGDKNAAVYFDSERKKMILGGNRVSRISDFIGWLGVTIISIDDIWIVRGAPSKRRAFLDWMIAKISPAYAADLAEYRKIVRQRNRYLQSYNENGRERLFEVLDERLIEIGNEIYKKREAKLPELRRRFAEFGENFGTKKFDLDYQSDCANMRLDNDMLKRVRSREIALGQTVIGPHRDDLLFSIDGRSMQHYASEGEERAASISLKLAEAEILYHSRGNRPILLLDEVSAELDRQKREILLGLLKGQVFYASTQLPEQKAETGKDCRTFHIEGGMIEIS
ncbi:MAG: DNA replication and repair protein RecF [candidate division WOR-3 bacterium]|nr:MAG: DNA replication and repair protein RecF [candidate division WOR-3 bacterium]